MRKSRLRFYLFLSLLCHIVFVWLGRFLPSYEPALPPPVAIRILDTPVQLPPQASPKPPPAPQPRVVQKPLQVPEKTPEKAPKPPSNRRGGHVVDLPKPVQEERPDSARIVSRYDSKAQDVGPGESAARKATGAKPPEMPPELALPQRKSERPSTRPQEVPASSEPSVSRQARVAPKPEAPAPVKPPTPVAKPRAADTPKQPTPRADKATSPPARRPEERRFPMTLEQEVAMLQPPQAAEERSSAVQQKALEEHFALLEKRQLSFDAPGTYAPGPERSGEGYDDVGGGRFRSISSFGLNHFSYLLGLQRKIELVFSVPPVVPDRGAIGVPIVGFTVRRDGVLTEAVLLRSSGYPAIDRALVNAVRRAAPYHPFPEHLTDPSISIRVYATVS